MEQATNQNLSPIAGLKKERIATQCVCCGSEQISTTPAVLMPFIAHRAFGWAPVTIDESWGLSSIQTGNAYSICKTLFCSSCGFIFLDIRFSDQELSNLYEGYRGEEYSALRDVYEPGYIERNEKLNAGVHYIEDIEKFLEPHLQFPLRILDWGGDTGKNTPFKYANEAFDIYDISNKQTIEGARIVSRSEAYSNKYNLIVCSNVLEHVPFPSELLLEIVHAMAEDTILYIEVPLEDLMLNEDQTAYLRKKHWHEHVNFFSEKSLKCLVENVGLEIVNLHKLRETAGGNSLHLFQIACRLASR